MIEHRSSQRGSTELSAAGAKADYTCHPLVGSGQANNHGDAHTAAGRTPLITIRRRHRPAGVRRGERRKRHRREALCIYVLEDLPRLKPVGSEVSALAQVTTA